MRLDRLSRAASFIAACATLGLAPFTPPHIWEKLQMLFSGRLVRPIDGFDLLLHGVPWILLLLKVATALWSRTRGVVAE